LPTNTGSNTKELAVFSAILQKKAHLGQIF